MSSNNSAPRNLDQSSFSLDAKIGAHETLDAVFQAKRYLFKLPLTDPMTESYEISSDSEKEHYTVTYVLVRFERVLAQLLSMTAFFFLLLATPILIGFTLRLQPGTSTTQTIVSFSVLLGLALGSFISTIFSIDKTALFDFTFQTSTGIPFGLLTRLYLNQDKYSLELRETVIASWLALSAAILLELTDGR